MVVLIKSGQMSFYDGDDPTCSAGTYSAGEVFTDSGQGHVHVARNEGNEFLQLWAVYFDVPPGGAFRIDAPNPGSCEYSDQHRVSIPSTNNFEYKSAFHPWKAASKAGSSHIHRLFLTVAQQS